MTWHEDAACIGMDSLFDAEPGASADDIEAAISICRTCDVRDACLAAAMAEEGSAYLRHTIRGGLTPEQRAARYRKGRS